MWSAKKKFSDEIPNTSIIFYDENHRVQLFLKNKISRNKGLTTILEAGSKSEHSLYEGRDLIDKN
jgi:hypothetical protein